MLRIHTLQSCKVLFLHGHVIQDDNRREHGLFWHATVDTHKIGQLPSQAKVRHEDDISPTVKDLFFFTFSFLLEWPCYLNQEPVEDKVPHARL